MYLDTAILVKLFTEEPDSEFYASEVEGHEVVSSFLALTEFWAAFLAKERNRLISPRDRKRAWERFNLRVEQKAITLLPMSEHIFKRANRILEEVHSYVPLRSLDALHLASCDQAQEWPLCSNDKRMRDAAERLRFPLVKIAP